ncbi:Serine O-succinyltransferase [Drechslerella dactyloides]|uniref:Serine O-succinyltransferase n=1 Tax=Drechslerella dactyloides TaxID=74499 RepID=A0AAD6IXS1_DREDA|nr:Serine O-succinyltransferase [Drechslerella dactyloides]
MKAVQRMLAAGRRPPRHVNVCIRTNHARWHSSTASKSAAVAAAAETAGKSTAGSNVNPQMAFPCLDALESRTSTLLDRTKRQHSGGSGPEPSYTSGGHQTFTSSAPLTLDWGGTLPSYNIAYETWGTLNATASNAILLHTGLSASSHAHSTDSNPAAGWWEKFIGEGPGFALDTSRFFVVCTNVIGGCYGSTGPGSIDPTVTGTEDGNDRRYATRFPIVTLEDMVRAQFALLDGLGVKKLYASVGSSMGGMQSLAAGVLFPERVGRVVSISGCARSHPYSIAMRFVQRQVLMSDPNWRRGNYYTTIPPHIGMKLAREIATVTYRSGPEWELRFSRRRADASQPPALCPDFLIETYLDHAGEKWCLEYDANSLLYISKAMDLFDLSRSVQDAAAARRATKSTNSDAQCTLTLPEQDYTEQPDTDSVESGSSDNVKVNDRVPPQDLVDGLRNLRDTPTLIIGVASDILFPAWQQREIADALRLAGAREVTHVELGEDVSLFGHDTFLLDTENVGGLVGRFLQDDGGSAAV